MSYVSLARKYRPRRFIDMVGQESTTLALTNAIRLRREPHSVIFTGVRGIGKTTSARIYAKALNCEKGPTAEPCDVCASCMAIGVGNHEDVLEIDGASNTGVDDVRALQETLNYVPQRSTYKVYIIDEVHMLSISAFNALLKTLEEPPQHVVFIFATTELHKVPDTIQSRCQTFHLQKISRPVIIERVRSILTAEEIPFDEAALAIVAREGRGSMRDALTMLDQAIAVGGGQVSLDALRNMVGSSSQALPVLELLDGLLRKDAGQILEVIARWDQEGLAMSSLAEQTAKACRNAFILRDLKGQAIDLQLLELEDREQQMLLELGEKAAPMDLNRLFRQLAKCLDDLRHADLDRFVLENYCLEWCFDPGLPDLQTLMNIISSGQPLPQAVLRSPTQSAALGDVPAINLRERWKTAAPSSSGARPSTASQAAAPKPSPSPMVNSGPAPAATPNPAPLDHAAAYLQAQLEKSSDPELLTGDPSPPRLASQVQAAMYENQAPSLQPAIARPSPGESQGATMQAAIMQTAMRTAEVATVTESVPVQPEAKQPSMNQAFMRTAEGQLPWTQPATVKSPHGEQPLPKANQVKQPQSSLMPIPASPPVVSPTHAATKAQGRTGALAQPTGSATVSDPLPPFDLAADEMPAWVLQEEATWQGVANAPQDERIAHQSAKNEGFLKQMARKTGHGLSPPVPPSLAETPTAAAPAVLRHEPLWPDSWRAFVDEWKKQKPLQGRVLEEAYILEYSPQRIRLAVEPTSMAGGKLLQQDVRKRLMEQFTQLFGFKGILEAVAKAEAHAGKAGTNTQAADLGETLLEVKSREREVAREQLRHRLEEHPMTREVISRFGGTIEQIELQ